MKSIISHTEHDYNSIKKIIASIGERYPFVSIGSIGKSVSGRDLPAIRIGRANEYVLYVGAFHGTERITTVVLLKFVEEFCEALKNGTEISGVNAQKAMYGRGLIVVPVINPDGCEIALKGPASCGYFATKISRLSGGNYQKWNANMRGVDINHNFDAGWEELHEMERKSGIYGPNPTRYGGPKPESEPETVALTGLCRSVKIRHVVAFHSQGEVIYWNYGNKQIPRAQKMAEIMATSTGYALDVPTGLALGGGFKDWFIEEYCRPGFTVEIGKGENPLQPEKAPEIYERLKEMMVLTVLM